MKLAPPPEIHLRRGEGIISMEVKWSQWTPAGEEWSDNGGRGGAPVAAAACLGSLAKLAASCVLVLMLLMLLLSAPLRAESQRRKGQRQQLRCANADNNQKRRSCQPRLQRLLLRLLLCNCCPPCHLSRLWLAPPPKTPKSTPFHTSSLLQVPPPSSDPKRWQSFARLQTKIMGLLLNLQTINGKNDED